MKKNLLTKILGIVLATTGVVGCSDWTKSEAYDLFEMPSDSYYKALRAYKKSDHQLSFGWFGNVTGTGASLSNSFAGLPDSMDIVSIWSATESDAYFEDMHTCQKVKGTRVVKCMFAKSVPAEFGWDGTNIKADNEIMVKAIQDYANSVCDNLYKKGYDGLDIDYEPTVGGPEAKGNLSLHKVTMEIWIKELGKRLGPKSGTNKLLMVDGEVNNEKLRDVGSYFDYFVSQAYNSSADQSLENKLKNTTGNYTQSTVDPLTVEYVTKRFIVTENFESVARAAEGGVDFTDRNGNKMKSLEGMARWKPANGIRKAGVGTYHMEAEYPTTPEYKHMRKAIQVMNPSSKSLIEWK